MEEDTVCDFDKFRVQLEAILEQQKNYYCVFRPCIIVGSGT